MSSERSKTYVGKGNPFFGKSHTEETREKIKKKNSVSIVINDILYSSQTEASKKLGI
ncbi:MAG: hypothetical protein H8D97_00940 [Proteobacteria bacterium]|nr:hypothetical protein [Pseudomonadota bacterium]